VEELVKFIEQTVKETEETARGEASAGREEKKP
jgi:hypothetical protein